MRLPSVPARHCWLDAPPSPIPIYTLSFHSQPIAHLECPLSPACQADALEEAEDPDSAPTPEPPAGEASAPSSSSSSSSSTQQEPGLVRRQKSALRRYVESFDQETMLETAR
jgi:hypothetical protein